MKNFETEETSQKKKTKEEITVAAIVQEMEKIIKSNNVASYGWPTNIKHFGKL